MYFSLRYKMNGKNKCIIKDMRKLRKRSIEMFYFAALPINPYKKHLKANKSSSM